MDSKKINHKESRDWLINELKKEVIGPEPFGEELDTSSPLTIENDEFKYKRFIDKNDNQEIMFFESPLQKYGTGILFPRELLSNKQETEKNNDELNEYTNSTNSEDDESDTKNSKNLDRISKRIQENLNKEHLLEDDEEFDMSGGNSPRPSAMGISFYAQLNRKGHLVIKSQDTNPMGCYKQIYNNLKLGGRNVWKRENFSFLKKFSTEEISQIEKKKIFIFKKDEIDEISHSKFNLEIYLIIRPTEFKNKKLITISLQNNTSLGPSLESICLFQSAFECSFDNNENYFLPYPSGKFEKSFSETDNEEKNLNLIYRNKNNFAIGHGCSVDWTNNQNKSDIKLLTNHFPIFDFPNITPDLKIDGNDFTFSMKSLAGLDETDIFQKLKILTTEYQNWINREKAKISEIEESLKEIANNNIENCQACLNSIQEGINFLKEDDKALKAFKLTNEAILFQQLRGSIKKKSLEETNNGYDLPNFNDYDSSKIGNWRPFQIAFLLTSIKSSVLLEDDKREDVELIFFPTGGGKTEAYLGLSAFTCFYRRLINPLDKGVQVLMRYTLRLLTAQQFMRASGLICAMELIRLRESNVLGEDSFSIGVWLGRDNTPNRNDVKSINNPGALQIYSKLLSKTKETSYPFLITKCPCCASPIGKTMINNKLKLVGLQRENDEIQFICGNKSCEFNDKKLPIYVVDEDVYKYQPSIIIGTVDKFVRITWNSDSKKIFGLNENGDRELSPPSLIIQDELHLITGPLGSMCGMYEGLIEDLCSLKKNDKVYKPKIICSTATIRSFNSQIKDLYNRTSVNLFPPFAINVEDSFFSKYATNENGLINPKKYLGLLTPNYGSIQTAQVRIYSRLLYSVFQMDIKKQDPWFTLMNFFGSLRELGTTISLIQLDIVDRLKLLGRRYQDDKTKIRRLGSHLNSIMELTSRKSSDEVSSAIDELSATRDENTAINKTSPQPIDICLASNVIEVGVDVPRLSLLTILGQPKTTSQYIQVSGRIGRNWQERPGLVVILYGHTRPRDKSHFEKFRTYHDRLYAQVEPMSVTPYSPPVIDKALHAALIGYIRMYGNEEINSKPKPIPYNLIEQFKDLISKRVKQIDQNEENLLIKKFKERIKDWENLEHDFWTKESSEVDIGLIHQAGDYLSPDFYNRTWITPTSMRDVDTESNVVISHHYNQLNNLDEE